MQDKVIKAEIIPFSKSLTGLLLLSLQRSNNEMSFFTERVECNLHEAFFPSNFQIYVHIL